MPRTPRLVVPGLPHHITQRGNYRQPVFFSPGDRLYFLRHLEQRACQTGIDVLGWCLMSNHFHLIAIPKREDSFAIGLRALLSEYTLHINARQERPRGHLWQGRFYSCVLPGRRVWAALRYVELNPVRARLVASPERYRWSSARFHLGLEPTPSLLNHDRHPMLSAPEWSEWLRAGTNPEEEVELRRCTRNGSPFGTPPPRRGRPKIGTEPLFL
jgi:putative transposase